MKAFSSFEGSPTQKSVVMVTLKGLGSVRSTCMPPACMNRPVVATPAVSRFRRVIVTPDMVYALAVCLVGRFFLHCDKNLAFLSRILAWRHFLAAGRRTACSHLPVRCCLPQAATGRQFPR